MPFTLGLLYNRHDDSVPYSVIALRPIPNWGIWAGASRVMPLLRFYRRDSTVRPKPATFVSVRTETLVGPTNRGMSE